MLGITALVAGTARGFSGFGAALIFIPIASALTSPAFAAPVLLVIDGIMTLPMVAPAFRLADRREVFTMAIGSIVAVPLGAWALSVMDPLVLRWAISALAVAMLGLIASGWRFRGEPHVAGMIGVGAVSGIFSGAAQIGGPPVVAWFTGRNNATARLRANIILFFAIGSVLTLASYLWRGLFSREVLLAALVTGPAYGLGLWLGARAFIFASPALFRRICLGLIGVAILIGLPLWT
ncbi:MAG: sulfite exporter TauE/SafE family protein [Deltaproteobacteria bacterium]